MHHRLDKSSIKRAIEARAKADVEDEKRDKQKKNTVKDKMKHTDVNMNENLLSKKKLSIVVKMPDINNNEDRTVTAETNNDEVELPKIGPIKKSVTFVESPPKTPMPVLTKYSARPRRINRQATMPNLDRAIMDDRFQALEKSLSMADARNGYIMLSSSSWGQGDVMSDDFTAAARYRPKHHNPLADYKFTKLEELLAKGKGKREKKKTYNKEKDKEDEKEEEDNDWNGHTFTQHCLMHIYKC